MGTAHIPKRRRGGATAYSVEASIDAPISVRGGPRRPSLTPRSSSDALAAQQEKIEQRRAALFAKQAQMTQASEPDSHRSTDTIAAQRERIDQRRKALEARKLRRSGQQALSGTESHDDVEA